MPPVTVAPNQRRYGTRLPFPGASLFPPVRPEASSVRDAASPCVHPPEESLKNQAPLGAFLPPRLLASSAQIAAVGNPGKGVWAAAALRTCPRANPGAASRLVPGYSALRRLELRLFASCSQLALSAATETCALGSLPYIYWLLSSQPVTHSWSLSPPLWASSCYSPSAARRGPPPPPSPLPPRQPVRHRSPPLRAALSLWVPQLCSYGEDQFSAIAGLRAETPTVGEKLEGRENGAGGERVVPGWSWGWRHRGVPVGGASGGNARYLQPSRR